METLGSFKGVCGVPLSLGLCRNNGKARGNYYLGFSVLGGIRGPFKRFYWGHIGLVYWIRRWKLKVCGLLVAPSTCGSVETIPEFVGIFLQL